MSQQMNDLRPLYLSAEEAMGLLDLCIMSQAEFDRDSEGVLLKLSDLVRQHLAGDVEEPCEIGKTGGEDPRSEPNGASQDSLLYTDNGRLPLSGAEFVAAHRNPAPGLKPCPAGRFGCWVAAPGM
jgi:hypothetical protein